MANILCIDDDMDVIEFLTLTLKAAGHHVETAPDGAAGFAKALSFLPDLIVLDVMMANTTEGVGTAFDIRNNEKIRHTPILMLTSINQEFGNAFKLQSDSASLPVDDFVEKPIASKTLLEKVSKLIARPRA
jgi:DNA-binding response OmpR family regulator